MRRWFRRVVIAVSVLVMLYLVCTTRQDDPHHLLSPRSPTTASSREKILITTATLEDHGQVQEDSGPASWSPPQHLLQRLQQRRRHVRQECERLGLTTGGKANAWEYVIHKPSRLVWCNVFKAASSSWIWNFNLLANYTEQELINTRKTPVTMLRHRYPRPSVDELQEFLSSSPTPLAFIISRHPLLRLVSAYRNKILVGDINHFTVFPDFYQRYEHLGPPVQRQQFNGKQPPKGSLAPSFPQFVQYVLDQEAAGNVLNEHWIPQSRFCTPCQVDFTVYAKVETLDEDGTYIIYTSGIDKVIKPRFINRSDGASTLEVAQRFLCQLLPAQREGLRRLYQLDFALFQYSDNLYSLCPTFTYSPVTI